jgi:hypothetical protein
MGTRELHTHFVVANFEGFNCYKWKKWNIILYISRLDFHYIANNIEGWLNIYFSYSIHN